MHQQLEQRLDQRLDLVQRWVGLEAREHLEVSLKPRLRLLLDNRRLQQALDKHHQQDSVNQLRVGLVNRRSLALAKQLELEDLDKLVLNQHQHSQRDLHLVVSRRHSRNRPSTLDRRLHQRQISPHKAVSHSDQQRLPQQQPRVRSSLVRVAQRRKRRACFRLVVRRAVCLEQRVKCPDWVKEWRQLAEFPVELVQSCSTWAPRQPQPIAPLQTPNVGQSDNQAMVVF